MTTSVSTLPAPMSAASWRSEANWSVGFASTGSVKTTVRPTFSSAWLIAWTTACTAAG